MRIAATLVPACLLVTVALGCQRGKQQAVLIEPHDVQVDPDALPADPFGSSSAAYSKLREVTDAALASNWSGELETFAPWLEAQTVSVERALALLKALRVGPRDIYAVANGRIAMLYDGIATALTGASEEAEKAGHDADWKGQEGRLWEQAVAFWSRCARGASNGGTHLDAWDLRCRAGLANSQAKLAP